MMMIRNKKKREKAWKMLPLFYIEIILFTENKFCLVQDIYRGNIYKLCNRFCKKYEKEEERFTMSIVYDVMILDFKVFKSYLADSEIRKNSGTFIILLIMQTIKVKTDVI